MARAYSWTTAETMNTESMAAVRNFLFDSCRDQSKNREGLDQSSGVRLVHWGICVTRITGWVLNYNTDCGGKKKHQGHHSIVLLSMLSWYSAHPEEVSVSVVIEPVMNHHVPGPVIVGERRRVPPVLGNQHREEEMSVWIKIKTEQRGITSVSGPFKVILVRDKPVSACSLNLNEIWSWISARVWRPDDMWCFNDYRGKVVALKVRGRPSKSPPAVMQKKNKHYSFSLCLFFSVA